MDASVVLEVLENLSKAPLSRSMLYLNIDRIKDLYHQSGGLDTIEIREDLTSDIAGGLNVAVAKIGSKLSRKEGNSRQLDISPLLMAILLEEDKKRNDLLLDPSVDIPLKKGALLKHTNGRQIIPATTSVHTYRAYFTGDVAVAQIIQTERERQVQEYQNLGLVRRIVVWVSPGKINLASIASTEFVNPNNFVSGGPGRTGILGLFENEIQGVIFISPLWIWGEY